MFAKILNVNVSSKAHFLNFFGKNTHSFFYIINLVYIYVLTAKALLYAAAVGPDTIPPAIRVDG